MEIINDPSLDPLARDSYDVFVKKVRTNFIELYTMLLTGAYFISIATTDLIATEDEITILGSSFTPQIVKQPTIMIAIMKDENDVVTDISQILQGAVLNNGYYDIKINAHPDDTYSSVTISVI